MNPCVTSLPFHVVNVHWGSGKEVGISPQQHMYGDHSQNVCLSKYAALSFNESVGAGKLFYLKSCSFVFTQFAKQKAAELEDFQGNTAALGEGIVGK